MAEERLIDDDKDRKYKIRINEDGEEELVIIDGEEEEEESDIPVFDIPVYEEDDEEAAVLTPEQLAERERIKEQEERTREEKLSSLLSKTRDKLAEGDFESALYNARQAEQVKSADGEVQCLKLRILTRNFTEFLNIEESAEAAEGVKNYASAEQKQELKGISEGLKRKISEDGELVAKLSGENEAGKTERRAALAETKTRSLATLFLTLGPLCIFLIATIVFSTMIFASEDGAYMIATIVLAALTFIAFICTMIAVRKYLSALRDCKLNESDSSTKIGREYLKRKNELELLTLINNSFDDDISR